MNQEQYDSAIIYLRLKKHIHIKSCHQFKPFFRYNIMTVSRRNKANLLNKTTTSNLLTSTSYYKYIATLNKSMMKRKKYLL